MKYLANGTCAWLIRNERKQTPVPRMRSGKGDTNRLMPTAAELIRFCNEIGLDLFGEALRRRIVGPADYEAFVNELKAKSVDPIEQKLLGFALNRPCSFEEKLRLALRVWTEVTKIAAQMIAEAGTSVPRKYSGDPRLEYRWRKREKQRITKDLRNQAVECWEAAFDLGRPIPDADLNAKLSGYQASKSKLPVLKVKWPFKSVHGMYREFRAFNCPAQLFRGSVTDSAAKELLSLREQWQRARAADRSERYRQP